MSETQPACCASCAGYELLGVEGDAAFIALLITACAPGLGHFQLGLLRSQAHPFLLSLFVHTINIWLLMLLLPAGKESAEGAADVFKEMASQSGLVLQPVPAVDGALDL